MINVINTILCSDTRKRVIRNLIRMKSVSKSSVHYNVISPHCRPHSKTNQCLKWGTTLQPQNNKPTKIVTLRICVYENVIMR